MTKRNKIVNLGVGGRFGDILREQRQKLGLTLKDVGLATALDVGLISKIEVGKRLANQKQFDTLVHYYNLDKKDIKKIWLSDKLVYILSSEEDPFAILQVAEAQMAYNSSRKSPVYSQNLQDLITKVDTLRDKWIAKKPLDTTQLKKLLAHFRVNYTYESNKIEGNTLSLQETYLVVNEGLTIGGKSMQEHLEAINHSEAIDYITDLVQQKEPFSERVLNEIHYLILKGIDRKNAGIYRNVPVAIGGSAHTPPQPYLVPSSMERIFEFYRTNHSNMHPVILAAEMHERIVTVHPFIDGNGRTSRLVMNLVLLMNGYTTAILKGDGNSRQAYYNALEETRIAKDSTPFHTLILKASIESLEAHLALT